MLQEVDAPAPKIEQTYKAREMEGIVDLHFYRPIGFRIAQFFAKRNVAPATVTLLGGFFGVMGGHFYFYQDLGLNLLGLFFQAVANAFDNADGQLARLLHRESHTGRILDGVVDHVVWASVYVHLAMRYVITDNSWAVLILAIFAAASHAVQAAAADFARTAYLYFAKGGDHGETDASPKMPRIDNAWDKVLSRLEANFARQQEMIAPALARLRERIARDLGGAVPESLSSRYLDDSRPLLKWWRLLMTNTRMLMLLLLLLVGHPVWFFWLEITLFNVLLVCLLAEQKRTAEFGLEMFSSQAAA